MTEVAFKPLSQAEQIFHDLVWRPMIVAGETYIEGQVPFLALPVIKQIDEEAIKVITEYMFHQLVMFIDITAIKLVNAAHNAAYNSESLKLRIVAQEHGPNSPEYIAERDKALIVLSKFTNIAAGQS